MNFDLLVDPELKTLIPSLDPNELKDLEESILEEGCRDALVVWKETDTLLDGHNRLEICKRLGKPYQIKLLSLPDRDAAKIWIINNQFGRRNLSPYQRSVLALKLKDIISEKVKAKETLRKTVQQTRPVDTGGISPVDKAIVEVLSKYKKQAYATPDRVYFIQFEDRVKIGSSCDIESRVKDVTKHLPGAKLIGFCEGGRALETELHKLFKTRLLQNEWYKVDAFTVSVIKSFLPTADFCQMAQVNSAQEAVEKLDIGERTVARVKVIEEKATPEQKEKLVKGEATINQVFTQIKRQEVKEQIKQTQWPTGKYRIIYADPPWQYSNSQPDYHAVQDDHYPTMPLSEIFALPVSELSLNDAVLFLWATSPVLEDAFKVINTWGFKYKASFIWDKVKHNMGHYNSVRHEFLLVAVRGSCQPDNLKLFDSVQTIERTDHSAKPEVFRTIIDTLYPYGKRIELFARAKADGWEQYGNQIS